MNIELVCVQKVSRVPNNGFKKLNVCLCPEAADGRGVVVRIRIREVLKEFYDCGIDFVKAAHHRFGNSPKMPRLVDLDALKTASAEVCVVRVLLFYV